MKLRLVIDGLSTLMPGVKWHLGTGTGGTDSARYCYSVWLRHLVTAKKNGLNFYPKIVAELGPGDSLGIGLAALISGCDKCFAFDVVGHASIDRNLLIFDELVTLFKNKTPIPGDEEWPRVIPKLEDYSFPSDVLDDDRLNNALESSRIEKIRSSVENFRKKDSMIEYKVPWYGTDIIEPESVDMIYSQAVLEHVDDLQGTYRAMHSWLKSTGYISHAIDFKCHGTAEEWNGHWTYSDFIWFLMRGKRPYLINREPHSNHIALMENAGLRIVYDKRFTSESKFTQSQLCKRFRSMSDEDLVTSEAFVQGVKSANTMPSS